jgi:hypothetical protein
MTEEVLPMHMNERMQDCVDRCNECREACLTTMAHCLEKGGRHASVQHITLLVDCAEICQTSANFMSRGSKLHAGVCGQCAEVCEACARSCEEMGDDAEMRRCAEACRACAQSCREMAAVRA